jgi:hypothetical protein
MTAPVYYGGSVYSPSGTEVHSRRLKLVTFTLNSVDYSCQLNNWNMMNNTVDGTKTFTYCGNPSEFRTETDNDYALQLKFFADWRLGGISDFLFNNSRAVATFVLDHLPDVVGEHVRWSGNCVLKAPTVGGDLRALEETSVTLLVLGLPLFTRVG